MKFSHFLILSLLSLLSFAFTALSNPHPFSDGGTPSLVLDADGGRLQAGVNYLVLPVIPGRGGGLSPANINEKSSCPRDIIQEASEIQTGFPVSFSPVDAMTGSVPLSTDINVKFFSPTVCSNETVWRVGKYDEVLKRYFIVTGGVEGNPGPETIANWFKIEKFESDYYKIVFCPSVCSICQVVCDDVGIYVGTGGTRFLALSDSPLVVKFKRAFPFTAPPYPVSHGPPQPVPFSYAPPPPVPFLHEPPPPPVPFPHAPPPPVPEPHGPPPPVPEPHRPPPPVPVPHGQPPPFPEPHRPPPPLVPVPAGPPPPDTSLAVATLQSPPYARPFVIFVSVLLFLGLS